MSKKLAGIKNLWKKANEEKGGAGFDELEDGRYMTIITDADVNESKASDRLQLMVEFKVIDGEFEGKTKRMYIGLDSETSIQIAVNTLARLGLEIEDPTELEERIKELVNKMCKIQLKTKSGKSGEFQNVYILKVTGVEPSEEVKHSGRAQEVDEPEVEDEVEEKKPAPEKKSKKAKAEPAPEPEPEAEATEEVTEEVVEDDEVELSIGMSVMFNLKKEEVEGKVTKIEEEQGTVIVEHKGKKYRVPGDKLSLKQ